MSIKSKKKLIIESVYSNDSEGNMYLFDAKDKEWCIHDGRSILYSVKCPELIAYLEKNKFKSTDSSLKFRKSNQIQLFD